MANLIATPVLPEVPVFDGDDDNAQRGAEDDDAQGTIIIIIIIIYIYNIKNVH